MLWGGALGTISLSTTATSATFADNVSPVADFHVSPREPEAFLDVADNTENTITDHNWTVEAIQSEVNVDTIEVAYPTGTSFDTVTDRQVTVEFFQSNGNFNGVKIEKADYTGSTATINITDNNAELLGEARIEIRDIENPNAGTYRPALTFTDVNGNEATIDTGMGIGSGSATFVVTILDAPTRVVAGETVRVDYEIENENTEIGSQTITFEINGTEVDSTSLTLGGQETYQDTFEYTSSTNNTPKLVAQVASENEAKSRSIPVGGVFGFDLSTYKQNQDAIHSWSTGFLDYSGEIEEITVEYASVGGGGGGGNGNNKGFDFDGLGNDGVTVLIEREGDSEPQEIAVVNGPFDGSTATFELDSTQATDVDGEISVVIDSIKNPKDGDYEGTIRLAGDDTHEDTVPFTITK